MTDSSATAEGLTTSHPAGTRRWLARLVRYMVRHRVISAITVVAVALGVATGVMGPLAIKAVLDGISSSSTRVVSLGLIALVCIAVLRFLSAAVERYVGGRLALEVQHDLRVDLFRAIGRLDGVKQDSLEVGQVVSKSTSDLAAIQVMLALSTSILGSCATLLGSIAVMIYLSVPLTMIALLSLPLLAVVGGVARRRLQLANRHAQQSLGQTVQVVADAVDGVTEVKVYCREPLMLERLVAAASDLLRRRSEVVRLNARFTPLLQAIPDACQVLLLLVGGYLAFRGSATVGTFVAFFAYLAAMAVPLRTLSGFIGTIQQAHAGAERVFEVIDSQPLVTDHPGAIEVPEGLPSIEFDHVQFGYARSHPVLHDVTFRVEPGETIAVVGEAGSGKSTLGLLVPRLYEVQGGSIRIGGVDVRDLQITSLRSRIGQVFEDTTLFSGTLGDNIAFGCPEADPSVVARAAGRAGLSDTIRTLPGGLDHEVGSGGGNLSGGQRQRVALARALLQDSDILILDDATSAVDSTTERAILRALRSAVIGRTTMIIAHRPSTLALASKILVLNEGQVEAFGSMTHVRETSPTYRKLFEQAEESDLSGILAGAGRATATSADPAPDLAEITGPQQPETTLSPQTPLHNILDTAEAVSVVRLLAGHRRRFSIAIGLLLLATAAQLVWPRVVGWATDDGVLEGSVRVLIIASTIAMVVAVARAALVHAQMRVTGITAEMILFELRVRVFRRLQRMRLRYFENHSSGRVMTTMTSDIDSLAAFVQNGAANAAVSLFTLTGVLGAMLVLDPRATLVAGAFIPIVVVATLIFRKHAHQAYAHARERMGQLNSDLTENLAGLRATQLFSREDSQADTFAALSRTYRDARIRSQRNIALFFPSIYLVASLASVAIFAYGYYAITRGQMTLGELVTFNLYLTMLFSPIQQLSQSFDGYQQAIIGVRRINDLMGEPGETSRPGETVQPLSHQLVLDSVTFSYTGDDEPAVVDVSVSIPAGQTVAVVGSSGSGKSTLIKLLARFYDPDLGSILIDGQDIRETDLTSYRQLLGYVPQDSHLIGDSISDAITFGSTTATRRDARDAVARLGVTLLITSLPNGFEHVLTGSSRLSAGERQVIALARAECSDPNILLLDEATASLDPATDRLLQHAQRVVASHRTTILIAHRLAAAQNADRVLVMHEGRLVEDGTHDELMSQGGHFRQLWNNQDELDPLNIKAVNATVNTGRA